MSKLAGNAGFLCVLHRLSITGKSCGLEALLRWQHPDKGMISPMEFIPLAEKTGLIIPIGKQLIRNACRQLSRWSSAGISPISLSLNVSAVQFRDRRFVEDLVQLVREEGLKKEEYRALRAAGCDGVQGSLSQGRSRRSRCRSGFGHGRRAGKPSDCAPP